MEKRSLTTLVMAAIIFGIGCGSAHAVDYTHIWIDQATGINHADTPGTPNEPFKSITYALARADYLGWPEPWHVHIGQGIYDANSEKVAPEREIFPIQLRQDMIFESGDPNDPNSGSIDPGRCIIDGWHLVEGFASLLYGNNLTGLEIRGLAFRNMYHNGNGGAIELVSCGGEIECCIIQDNSAKVGGGLWLSPRGDGHPFDFISCTFADNSATATGTLFGDGGGFCVNGTLTGNVTGCSFSGNSARETYYTSGEGGGFYVSGSVNGNISGCSFTGNSANSRGGGFNVSGTVDGNVADCSFTDNYGGGSGGGFGAGTLNGNVADCSFIGNSLYPGYTNGMGGGFSIERVNGNIIGCSFTDNYAGGGGGGFYVWSTSSSNISDCQFVQNSGGGGLALHLNNTLSGKVENCKFLGHEGEAIRLARNSGTTATIRSCLFVAPVTLGEVSGWAVRTKQKTIICNNTMVGPGIDTQVSPSAVYIDFNTQAENGQIFNNIIVESKRAIHVNAGLDMPITYNHFYNVADIVCQGEQCLGNDIWWLEWNLSNFRHNDYGDPLFFAYDPTYHIQETSPCVDTGDPNYVMEPNETDIDGQPRVAGLGIDRGADEYLTYLLTADLYHDGIVNFLDYALLTSYWRQNEPFADIAPPGGDGIVDWLDVKILCEEWLQTEPWY